MRRAKNPNDPKYKQSIEKNNEAVKRYRAKQRDEIKKIKDAIKNFNAENYTLQGKISMQKETIKYFKELAKNLNLTAEEQIILNAIDDDDGDEQDMED